MIKIFSRILITLAALVVIGCGTVGARGLHGGIAATVTGPQVYTGCTAVPTSFAGSKFYVNPTTGNDSNPGTFGSPFLTVGAAAQAAVGLVGASIYLEAGSGPYPDDIINSARNTSFVEITAAPGQSPVFAGRMRFYDSNFFYVHDIQFQGIGQGPFITTESDDVSRQASDIVIFRNNLSSAPLATVLSWNVAQAQANLRGAHSGGFHAIDLDGGPPATPTGSCQSATYNTITGVGDGITAAVNNSVVAHNTISYFGDDGIDFAASNLDLSFNSITNNFYIEDSNHNDGMQGQIGRCPDTPYCTFSNIVINANSVFTLTVPAASIPLSDQCGAAGAMQGIGAFDEAWDNLTITNNVIAVCATQILSFYSLSNSTMANNVAIDSFQVAGDGGCTFELASHQSTAPISNHNLMRNNICSNIHVPADLVVQSNTIDHNLVMKDGRIDWTISGSATFNSTPGTYGTANVITANANSTVVTTYDNSTPLWDFHLPVGSIAIGAGTTPAPNKADGTARTAPVDEGAY